MKTYLFWAMAFILACLVSVLILSGCGNGDDDDDSGGDDDDNNNNDNDAGDDTGDDDDDDDDTDARRCHKPGRTPLPKPTGEFCVAGSDYHLIDADRDETFTEDPSDHRELFVRVYLPADSTVGQPQLDYPAENGALNFVPPIGTHTVRGVTTANSLTEIPILLLSPGFGVPLEVYAAWAEELASHGYIVLAVGHPFYSGRLRLSSGAVAEPDMTIRTITWPAIEIQSRDLSFVLSHFASLPDDAPWAAAADWNRVVAFGHSQGATAAGEVAHDDNRVKGAVFLDGDPASDCLWSGLSKPFLVQFNSDNYLDSATGVQCTGMDDPTEGWHINQLGGDSCNFYLELGAHAVEGSYHSRLTSPNHMAFSDFAYLPFGGQNKRTALASRALTLAFAEFALRDVPNNAYADVQADFPDIDIYPPPYRPDDPEPDPGPPRDCLDPSVPTSLPAPTGEYCVLGHDYHLLDETRKETFTPANGSDFREVMVRLFLPADGTAYGQMLPYPGENGPRNGVQNQGTHTARGWTPAIAPTKAPVVILSPDLGVSLELYTAYAEELASHGYIVLAVGHAGFSGKVWLSSGITLPTGADEVVKTNAAIEIMRGDLAFVLSHFAALPKDAPWTSTADFEHVITFGHGQGAAAAAEFARDDSRVIAVALLDGDPAADALHEGLSVRFLSMFSARNFNDQTTGPLCTGLDDPTEPWLNDFAIDSCNPFLELISHATQSSYFVRLTSPDHLAFSDNAYASVLMDDLLATAEASRVLLLAFADRAVGRVPDDDYEAFRATYSEVDLYPAGQAK